MNKKKRLPSSILVGTSRRARSGYANVREMPGRVGYYEAEIRYRGERIYVGSGDDPRKLSIKILKFCIKHRIPYRIEKRRDSNE